MAEFCICIAKNCCDGVHKRSQRRNKIKALNVLYCKMSPTLTGVIHGRSRASPSYVICYEEKGPRGEIKSFALEKKPVLFIYIGFISHLWFLFMVYEL